LTEERQDSDLKNAGKKLAYFKSERGKGKADENTGRIWRLRERAAFKKEKTLRRARVGWPKRKMNEKSDFKNKA